MARYLEEFHSADVEQIRHLLDEKRRWLSQPKKGIIRYRNVYDNVKHIRAEYLDFSGDIVTIGERRQLSDAEFDSVRQAMLTFMPWRKGPFNVFGIDIDAEWRSERKWNRLQPVLPDLAGKVIADIGCNNGYYMFRMAHHRPPRWVIGFEPYLHHYFTFKTLNCFAGRKELQAELLGVEHVGLFRKSFDVVFLLGILYHRKSPVETLMDVKTAMRPGGVLLVESQAIPGQDAVALFPAQTYAKVPGTYFVPTATCLKNWMLRAGFEDVAIFFSHPMSSEEQRRTDWMTFESYADFIDPRDPSRTIEGYPAPLRVFLKGVNPS